MKKIYLAMILTVIIFATSKAQLIMGRFHVNNSISASSFKNSPLRENLDKTRKEYAFSKNRTDSTNLEIAKYDSASSAKPAKYTAVGGAFSFPFKLRPQSGTLEPSLSLSAVGGLNITSNRFNDSTNSDFGFYLGIGSSSITLNSNNSTVTSTTTRAAITFSFTFLYEVEGLQLALSTGWNNNLDNSMDKWRYQSKPWISAGIGFSIFTKSKK